ncbi:MAG: hypothetical protein Q8P07_01230 [bacterium]|nr:hypothetical protein [bacterium]
MITDQDIQKLSKVLATREDLKALATKEDLKALATKKDLGELAGDVVKIEERLEKIEDKIEGVDTRLEKMDLRLANIPAEHDRIKKVVREKLGVEV